MSWNTSIRRVHRWLSIAFTLGVIVNAVAVAASRPGQPAGWVYLLALVPLFALLATGLYLFVLPYAAGWRSTRGERAQA